MAFEMINLLTYLLYSRIWFQGLLWLNINKRSGNASSCIKSLRATHFCCYVGKTCLCFFSISITHVFGWSPRLYCILPNRRLVWMCGQWCAAKG